MKNKQSTTLAKPINLFFYNFTVSNRILGWLFLFWLVNFIRNAQNHFSNLMTMARPKTKKVAVLYNRGFFGGKTKKHNSCDQNCNHHQQENRYCPRVRVSPYFPVGEFKSNGRKYNRHSNITKFTDVAIIVNESALESEMPKVKVIADLSNINDYFVFKHILC